MNRENSGKIFKFKLDHDRGYMYAEFLDFTDKSKFSGNIIYVFSQIDSLNDKPAKIDQIIQTDIVLGPIIISRPPSNRGKGAWKLIGKTPDLLIEALPVFKETKDPLFIENWNDISDWAKVHNFDSLELVDHYQSVRSLETKILNTKEGISTKATMRGIINDRLDINDFYDMNNLSNRTLFVQLVNTYYSLEETMELLKLLPPYEGPSW